MRGRTFLLQGQGDVTTNTAVGGTTNTVAKFTSPFQIGDSSITDDGTTVAAKSASITDGGLALARTGGNLTHSAIATTSGFPMLDYRGFRNETNVTQVQGGVEIRLRNLDTTTGNYTSIINRDSNGDDNAAAVFVNDNHTTNAGSIAFLTRPASGSLTRAWNITSAGNLSPNTDNSVTVGIASTGIKQLFTAYTDTSAGVTGNRTIDKMSGSVNFAALMTTLVVTNSVVTTSSKIFASISTSGSTGVLGSIVPASGSFAINMTTAPNAETRVQWFVLSTN